jgi:hypothetical protein
MLKKLEEVLLKYDNYMTKFMSLEQKVKKHVGLVYRQLIALK